MSDITSVVCDVVPAAHPTALGILSSLPTLQGTTRLAIFCSSAAVFNSQLSVAQQQIRLLQAEISTLKDTIKALAAKKDSLAAENETSLREKAKLEDENRKLVDELRVERFQGNIRIKKAREDKKKIGDLVEAAKQRDYFVRAMIDIKLDHPVLNDAYVVLKDGQSADKAIIEAIRSAANKQTSPWSRLLGPVDVAKSDLYKSAIELAATARLRMDESSRLARFWKHMAKHNHQNVGVITPSSSALEVIGLELEKEERGTVLDDLLKKLRSGEGINKEEKKQPFFLFPVTSDSLTPSTPEPYCEDTRSTDSGPSTSTLISDACGQQPTDPTAMDVLLNRDSNSFASENPNVASFVGPSSLERIYGAFMTTSSEETVGDHELHACQSLGCLGVPARSLQSIPASGAGLGRSATFPFSKKDLTLPPVMDVMSGLTVVTLPGAKEREVQAMVGHRAQFHSGTSLTRSKAIINKRRRSFRSQTPKSPTKRARTPGNSNSMTSKPVLPLLSIRNVCLPTPPPEGDSIAYVRPPTVTRKRVTGPLSYNEPLTTSLVSPTSPTPGSSFPQDQRIKPYAVRGPLPPSPPQSNALVDAVARRTWNPDSVVPLKSINQINKKPRPLPIHHTLESNKETISPQTKSISADHGPRRRKFESPTASSRIPITSPPKTSRHYSAAFKPNLQVVQPLRIIKKNPIQTTSRSVEVPGTNSIPSPFNSLPRSRFPRSCN